LWFAFERYGLTEIFSFDILVSKLFVFLFSAATKIKEGINDVGEGIKNGVSDAQDAINDQLGGTCITSDDCSFYQSCEMASCKITNTAWIVIAVVAGLLVLGVISCICCCVKKIFCCGN